MTGRALLIAYVLAHDAYADETSPPPAATPAASTEPYWLIYAAIRNDAFTELDPPIDDQGFTHDNVLAVRREQAGDTLGGSFIHRFITSREDRRRWDLVEVFATAERARPDILAIAAPHVVATTLRAGPTLGGNFGGRYIQNGFHALTRLGPTLDEGLQDTYPEGRKLGLTLGGRARAEVGDRLRGYSFIDGQLAVGSTGVTSMQAALGGNAASTHVGAHVEIALTRYHVGDANLALPGAYGAGWQLEWRVGVDVHWSRFRVGYEYRANESGSGEPMGLVELSSVR